MHAILHMIHLLMCRFHQGHMNELTITRELGEKTMKKPIRTKYLWANTVIIDDVNHRCPVIEG